MKLFPSEHYTQIIESIRNGRYSLLLGAGFSCSSTSADGVALPSGSALAKEIAQMFKLPDKYALSQLVDAIPPEKLQSHFESRFKGCHASPSAKLVSSFVWKNIFTFNIDDVLVDCYNTSSALQKINILTHLDYHAPPEDPEELQLVHLHGYVRRPGDKYVFSAREYGQSAAGNSSWFTIFADHLTTLPFIIVGCALDEPDVEYYLARRQNKPSAATQVSPSIFVTKELDPVLISRCERFGLLPIEMGSDPFWDKLNELIGVRPRPIDLITPKISEELFSASTDARAIRVFLRQWLFVDPQHEETFPVPIKSMPLLRGSEPTWHAILSGEDIIRQNVREIITKIVGWTQNPTSAPCLSVLYSASGEGRSTILLRVSYELAKLGVLVFYYNDGERLNYEETAKVIIDIKKPVVLVVDNLASHASQVGSLRDSLEGKPCNSLLLGAERLNRETYIRSTCGGHNIDSMSLKPLSKDECVLLAQHLRAHGLLGLNARKGDEEIAKRITGKQLISAVITAGAPVELFQDAILSELHGLSPEAANVYKFVALAHSTGIPIRIAIIQRAIGYNTNILFGNALPELKDLLVYLPPLGEYIEVRHRVIAELIVNNIHENERFDILVSIATALRPYVNRKSIMRGAPEARLAGMLLDLDGVVKNLLRGRSSEFYEQIKDDWQWNSRYWEQKALSVLSEGNFPLAAKYAEHAVGIERHPHSFTTLAKIQFKIADMYVGTREGDEMIKKAISTANSAIEISKRRRRAEIHPFDVSLRGIKKYLEGVSGIHNYKFSYHYLFDSAELILSAARNFLRSEDFISLESYWMS